VKQTHPSRIEVEKVLEKLANLKILGRNLRIASRRRSQQDLADLEMTGSQREEVILSLEVSNFSHCQSGDAGFGRVYVFGYERKRIEIYVKLGDLDKTPPTCISFHKSDHPLEYPYRDPDAPSPRNQHN